MRAKLKPTLLVLLFVPVLMLGTTVLAQSSASFDLSRHVIGGGGGESGSASYRVNGTIGQSIAGPSTSGSASFTVSSGYWSGDTRTSLYLPVILRN
jgi:hypothetical protein